MDYIKDYFLPAARRNFSPMLSPAAIRPGKPPQPGDHRTPEQAPPPSISNPAPIPNLPLDAPRRGRRLREHRRRRLPQELPRAPRAPPQRRLRTGTGPREEAAGRERSEDRTPGRSACGHRTGPGEARADEQAAEGGDQAAAEVRGAGAARGELGVFEECRG